MIWITRRKVLGFSFAGAVVAGLAATGMLKAKPSHVTDTFDASKFETIVYRSPTCGCCAGWEEHMRAEGFQVSHRIVEDMTAIKQEHRIPEQLLSCHTTVVGDYIIEGHVPADAVARLLREKPDVVGIAVPGMPLGTPGMESGNIRESFAVFTFNEQGQTEVFDEYRF